MVGRTNIMPVFHIGPNKVSNVKSCLFRSEGGFGVKLVAYYFANFRKFLASISSILRQKEVGFENANDNILKVKCLSVP